MPAFGQFTELKLSVRKRSSDSSYFLYLKQFFVAYHHNNLMCQALNPIVAEFVCHRGPAPNDLVYDSHCVNHDRINMEKFSTELFPYVKIAPSSV
jgi:hypothetical protein